jgi:hypothetical protein
MDKPQTSRELPVQQHSATRSKARFVLYMRRWMRFSAIIGTLLASNCLAAPPCDAPPYGDTSAKYVEAVRGAQWLEHNSELPVGTVSMPMESAIQAVCNAKFNGESRYFLNSTGFSDKEIDALGTIAITNEWVIRKGNAIFECSMHSLSPKAVRPDAPPTDCSLLPRMYQADICRENSDGLNCGLAREFSGDYREVAFDSLNECTKYIRAANPGRNLRKDGRIVVNRHKWWTCNAVFDPTATLPWAMYQY